MLIRDKKHFALGSFMTIVFAGVLFCMFMPIYKGHNALQYSDKLFNSMAKGSTYFMGDLSKSALKYNNVNLTMKLRTDSQPKADLMAKILTNAGQLKQDGTNFEFTANMGELLLSALKDSKSMFMNKDEDLTSKYHVSGKEAMYGWWLSFNAIEKSLKAQKKFKDAAQFASVNKKAIEVGYNFFGIDSEKANDEVGVLAFALVFYVVYTLWWGLAILFLFEGVGFKITKGAKSES